MSSSSALNSLFGSSSSGIDIASLLQTAFGASSSGIDVTSAVNSAVAAARTPEATWQAQQTNLQSQASALNQLQIEVSSLQDDLASLNNAIGPLAARMVTSSNNSVVSGSASANSSVGAHVIVVNSLATTASWASAAVANASTILGAGSFTITAADGSTTNFSTANSTVADLASQINTAALGVTATVITDASGSRLAIASSTPGTAANFSVSATSGSALTFTQASTGSNASLLVDGIQVDSASNTVAGAIPGVTLNLLNAAPGTNISITIAPDSSQAAATIGRFVSDYNTIIKDLNSQYTFNGRSEGVLASDSALRVLQADLLGAVSYSYVPTARTTSIPSLTSLGISVQNDGTLTIDTAKLNEQLQNNFSDAQNFFQGTAFNGFAQALQTQLSSFTSPVNGAFTLDLQTIHTQYNDLQNDVDNFETNYIVPLRARLQSDYSQAEILLQKLPSELNQINAMLGVNTSNR